MRSLHPWVHTCGRVTYKLTFPFTTSMRVSVDECWILNGPLPNLCYVRFTKPACMRAHSIVTYRCVFFDFHVERHGAMHVLNGAGAAYGGTTDAGFLNW